MAALFWGVVALLLLLSACLAASVFRFGRPPAPPEMGQGLTLIKPVRGLDENLERNFESVLESDAAGRVQLIIAMESAEDPAHGAARRLAAAHPERDILVLVTGPSGRRMGKIHNMIEALPRAKYDRVVFSDADIKTTPGLLRETSQAFDAGYDAVFGLPYHVRSEGLGGWLFMAAFNHYFCVPAALNFYLGGYRFCAGAWMGYTKAILEKAGGLGRLERVIADDFAISDAVSRAGARKYLLSELVAVEESGRSAGEALVHLAKWASIIRSSLPGVYLVVPLANPSLLALGLLGVSWKPLAAAMIGRALVGLAQDALAARMLMPWWGYPLLAFSDLGAALFWLSGFRSKIAWRGKSYRLLTGGRVEVL